MKPELVIPVCDKCSGELIIMAHEFCNGTVHCASWCKVCFFKRHLPIENLVFVNASYEKKVWIEMKRRRKHFLKKQKKEALLASVPKNEKTFKLPVPTPKTKKIIHSSSFYESRPWQDLRFKVLRQYGRRCMLCFAVDVEIHVDHIKPISKFPELKLDIDNLQVLCRACNMGKSNKDFTDFRPGILRLSHS